MPIFTPPDGSARSTNWAVRENGALRIPLEAETGTAPVPWVSLGGAAVTIVALTMTSTWIVRRIRQ